MSADIELGLCLAAFGGSRLADVLDQVAAWGPLHLDVPTDSVLGLVDGRRCLHEPGYRQDIAAGLKAASVTCVSNSRDTQLLLGPHGRHTDPVCRGDTEAKRRHAVESALGTLLLADAIDAPAVRLQVGCPDFARWLSWWGSDVSWSDNVAEFITHMRPLLRTAGNTGVDILLEPHPKQIVYDRESAELLLDAAATVTDRLRLCVDPANLAATGHDPVDAVMGWDGRMAAVHAKDLQLWRGSGAPRGAGWSRYGPQPAIRFRALGHGELDWSRIVGALADEEFRGVLYLEHEDALLPREQSIGQGLAMMRSLLPAGPAQGRTW